ncbi:MAG: FtsW/RodA/SpoVE family cell cycle protein [Actinomycetia bacterium]|nr:FtsW/RodA/SpoVE family cell cycle protein [Actinomycetes bacterium]
MSTIFKYPETSVKDHPGEFAVVWPTRSRKERASTPAGGNGAKPVSARRTTAAAPAKPGRAAPAGRSAASGGTPKSIAADRPAANVEFTQDYSGRADHSSRAGRVNRVVKAARVGSTGSAAGAGKAASTSTPAVSPRRHWWPAWLIQPSGASLMLIVCCLILLIFGLAMGFSASFAYGKTGTEQLLDQLKFAAIGLGGVVVLLLVSRKLFAEKRQMWFALASVIWLLSLLSMVLVWVPGLGVSVNGAARWLDLGLLRFQPSEFAKVALVLFASASLERIKTTGSRPLIILLIVSFAAMVVLTIQQNDFGSLMLLYLALLAVLYFGDMPLLGRRWSLAVSILPHLSFAGLLLAATYFLPSFRQSRWAGFWSPLNDVTHTLAQADQLRNGFLAMGDGGLTGLGFALSKQKYFYLSFPDSDFIYAVIGEELGLIGATAVILLFLLLAFSGLRVAALARSRQGRMLAGSATALLVIQALVNIGGVTGVLPLTGKPLPFFSNGGSSLVGTLLLVGCILAVAWFDQPQDLARQRRDALRLVKGGAPDRRRPVDRRQLDSDVRSARRAANGGRVT